MQSLIHFRQASDSLSDEEYQICINQFLRKCSPTFDRKSVSSIIFNSFYNEFKDDNMDNINTMNKIIKQILNKRIKKIETYLDDVDMEQDNIKEDNIEKMTLDKLPQKLLTEIVPYLEFIERTQLEKTNRSIFIDVRSSRHRVHHFSDEILLKLMLFYDGQDNYDINDYKQFDIFKSLTLDAHNLSLYWERNNSVTFPFDFYPYFILFGDIVSLQIEFDDHEDLDNTFRHMQIYDCGFDLETFRINGHGFQNIYFDTIEHVKQLFTCASEAEYFEISGKFKMELSFEALQYDWHDHINYDFEWIYKLKGIAIYDYQFNEHLNDSIYCAMGYNVNSLHHDWLITNNINQKLEELKEFCTSWCLKQEEIDILMKQNMNNLERIYFKYSKYLLRGFTGELAQNMVLLFDKILKTVQYVGFSFYDRYKEFNESYRCPTIDLFHILNTSLKNKTKNKLKIRMEMGIGAFKNNNEIFDMIGKLKELIEILNRNVCDWMVIISDLLIPVNNKMLTSLNLLKSESMKKQYSVNIDGKPIKWADVKILDANDSMNELLSWMSRSAQYKAKHNKNKTVKSENTYNEYNVVISNQNCKINGYYEHWIMECQRCRQETLDV